MRCLRTALKHWLLLSLAAHQPFVSYAPQTRFGCVATMNLRMSAFCCVSVRLNSADMPRPLGGGGIRTGAVMPV